MTKPLQVSSESQNYEHGEIVTLKNGLKAKVLVDVVDDAEILAMIYISGFNDPVRRVRYEEITRPPNPKPTNKPKP